ncbi:MAG: glutamate--tRNA ligase [Chitinophagales bacterium]
MASEIRLRYAPSPTGAQHLGGIRTALYNYLYVQHMGGKLILRIEDTDQSRYVPGAEQYVIESCAWAGITFDESPQQGGPYGPYRQSERKEMYREYAMQLIQSGHAYYAFDTPEELEEMRNRLTAQGNPAAAYDHITRQYMKNSTALSQDEVEKRLASGDPYVIRMKMPRNEEVKFHDLIRGWVVFNTSQLDDKVLFKSDGMPTYHLANVVDDHLMHISHVVRGEEWLPSAPTHVMLYAMLGWSETMPQFAHLPLILKPEGNGKLSKRDGDKHGFPLYSLDWKEQNISGLKEKGFLPEAYINFLAFLGWNPGTDQEIFSRKELIDAFGFERIGKSGARFDPEKAKWFNQQHMRLKSGDELAALLHPFLDAQGITVDPVYLASVCELMKERAVFIPDLYAMGKYFFEEIDSYDTSTLRKKWKPESAALFRSLTAGLDALPVFDATEIEQYIKSFMLEKGMGMGDIMPILRIALAGGLQGPPVFNMMNVLGKKISVERLYNSIEKFDNFQ